LIVLRGTVILTSFMIDAGKCALRGSVISPYIAGKCHAGIRPPTKVSRGEVPPHRKFVNYGQKSFITFVPAHVNRVERLNVIDCGQVGPHKVGLVPLVMVVKLFFLRH
jgi:hypothetical protein